MNDYLKMLVFGIGFASLFFVMAQFQVENDRQLLRRQCLYYLSENESKSITKEEFEYCKNQ